MEYDQDNLITIDDLYPNLAPDQRQEAEENLDAYIRIITQINNRELPEQLNDEVEANVAEEN